MKKNPDMVTEKRKFEISQIMNQTINETQKNLGLANKLTFGW